MTKNKEILKNYLSLLESVPEEDFILNQITNNKDKCCAIGHLFRLESECPENYNFDSFFRRNNSKFYYWEQTEIKLFEISGLINSINLGHINNRKIDIYQQETPKARVLAYLKDLINGKYDNQNI